MRAKPGYISLKVFSTAGPGRVTGQSHVAAHQDSPPETEHRLERLRVLVVGELVGQEPHHSALHHRPLGELVQFLAINFGQLYILSHYPHVTL